jgi:aminopeptidase-like protein
MSEREQKLEAALRDALEGMEDMIVYVPSYYREKWNLDCYITSAREALGIGRMFS